MTIDRNSGLMQWTPTPGQLGTHTVRVVATDPFGAGAIQTFTLTARANAAPVFLSTPTLNAAAGTIYRYDVRATDPNTDLVSYQLTQSPPGMTIDLLGRIVWATQLTSVGVHPIVVTIRDPFGATASQAFDLNVVADTQAPLVTVSYTANPVNVGQDVSIILTATDNVGVALLTLTVNGQPIVLDALGQATIATTSVGSFSVVATAIDAAGNQRQATDTLTVIDPTIVGQPLVAITTPADFDQITAPIAVTGTVDDPNLVSYTLSYSPLEGGDFIEFARGSTNVANSVLGIFDPSNLANGDYIIELRAIDAGGNESSEQRVISVTGDLKVGNFTLSFTDLTVPVSGIPITLSRTYDSLNAQSSGDFGHGWRLELKDTDLRTSVPKTGAEEDLIYNP
jgi:Domain of unknown function (DUF6531)/Putative Ig domain